MQSRVLLLTAFAVAITAPVALAETPSKWWSADVETALAKAKDNRGELEKSLTKIPDAQRKGLSFLIANMPDSDLTSLSCEFLLTNCDLAYKARNEVPWGKTIPEDLFLNDVLAYANVDEKRDEWRKEFYDLCMPIAKQCKTPSEAAQRLNRELFPKLKVGYSTKRKAPNQSPKESIEQGKASCTGLSIVLSDACRAICVPARIVGTPLWANKRGNHTWVEIWDKDWQFTGACEPDPNGLNRGWFVGDAAQAKKDSFEHAIYASSFRKTKIHFPLVWATGNKDVPAENVTERYTQKAKADAARLMIRVTDADKKRIAVAVQVVDVADAKSKFEGKSRDESADTNDFLTFNLKPDRDYTIKVVSQTKTIKAPAAGKQQIIDFVVTASDAARSADAVSALRNALATTPYVDLADKDFAQVALTRTDAQKARELIWNAHLVSIKKDRAAEVKDRVLKDGKLEMPFFYKTFGKKPANGWSLWISLHGGGGAPKNVNDSQWENQKKLYAVEEGIYLAPRAPTNTWNLWHEGHIDRLFARLIEDLIVHEDVNPDRVYVLGYSAGGDGVYQIGPRMADHWAGAAMMAGHPNGVSLLSLRNVPFALQVGGNDSAYGRNKVGKEYGEQLEKLHKEDPKGYHNFVKIHEGMGHWMKLEDKAALPWMAGFTRNPVPDKVVWKQTGAVHDRSYWLAVPPNEAKGGSLAVATRNGQAIDVMTAENINTLIVRLDDRVADLDKPVIVSLAGKQLYSATPSRTIGVMIRTLAGRGDPKLMFDAEIRVGVGAK